MLAHTINILIVLAEVVGIMVLELAYLTAPWCTLFLGRPFQNRKNKDLTCNEPQTQHSLASYIHGWGKSFGLFGKALGSWVHQKRKIDDKLSGSVPT